MFLTEREFHAKGGLRDFRKGLRSVKGSKSVVNNIDHYLPMIKDKIN